MKKLLLFLVAYLQLSNSVFSSQLFDGPPVILRNKALMKNEVSSDQLVLTIPIIYNQTNDFEFGQNFPEKRTVPHPLLPNHNNTTGRVRRGWDDWGLERRISACVGTVLGATGGALAGAISGAAKGPWGAVVGGITGYFSAIKFLINSCY
jgi:hypothetical protein